MDPDDAADIGRGGRIGVDRAAPLAGANALRGSGVDGEVEAVVAGEIEGQVVQVDAVTHCVGWGLAGGRGVVGQRDGAGMGAIDAGENEIRGDGGGVGRAIVPGQQQRRAGRAVVTERQAREVSGAETRILADKLAGDADDAGGAVGPVPGDFDA